MRINRNAQKICRCDPPSYVIDTKNRLVQCDKCNAYIHPFDALVGLAENIEWYTDERERLNKERNELIRKQNDLIKEVNTLSTKRFRMNAIRDLQNEYMSGMMPSCPHCEKPFDPTEITGYTNKNYCNYKKKRTREEKIYRIANYKAGKGLDRWDKMDKIEEELESWSDEELDKEIEKIKEWLGDD